jgi:hypothetical protein
MEFDAIAISDGVTMGTGGLHLQERAALPPDE